MSPRQQALQFAGQVVQFFKEPVLPAAEPSPAVIRAERLAFTFCKMGTTGLLCWLFTPPVFVFLAAVFTVALYGRALYLGVTRSRCLLRRPALIAGCWTMVAVADAAWLLARATH